MALDETNCHGSDSSEGRDHDAVGEPPLALSMSSLANDGLGLLGAGRSLLQQCRFVDHDGDTLHVTMKDVKLNRNAAPLHDQVAAEIRRDIAKGDVHPGQRLPPAKDMAAVLGVHPNTVLRALRILRDEGILEFRRGRGITVVGEPERRVIAAQARDLLRVGLSEWIRARGVGLHPSAASLIPGRTVRHSTHIHRTAR